MHGLQEKCKNMVMRFQSPLVYNQYCKNKIKETYLRFNENMQINVVQIGSHLENSTLSV